MGRSWCAGLPRVTAERSAVPTRVTLILPFYDNDDFLQFQLAGWRAYPAEVTAHVSLIVVDDGSPGAGAAAAVRDQASVFPMRVFRINEDIRWNWLAARNIGAHHAADGWLLLTDMDHVVPVETLRAIVYGVHRTDTIYGFSRVEHSGEELAPHPNSWLMTRAMFWKVGGYDETLSGHYGTDGDWRRRCAATAPMAILTDRLARYEYVGDSSTRRYQRKQPIDAAVPRLVAARTPQWTPKTLSFPYVELPC